MGRTAVVILTWNRLHDLQSTIKTFKQYHKDIEDRHFIVVDNGSTDGTADFLKITEYTAVLNSVNTGAQMGKYIGWNAALEAGYDFILFIEDDHPCYGTVPIKDLEKYLDDNLDVGIIRLNDKPYLVQHQITKLPIDRFGKTKINKNSKVVKYNYHFTSNPSLFRTSLVQKLKGCVFPECKPANIDVASLGFEKYKDHKNYKLAKKRALIDFGVAEKEYMRLYLLNYKLTAQLFPQCFHTTFVKRVKEWRN